MFDVRMMDLAHSAKLDALGAGTPLTPLAPLVLFTAGAAVVLGLGALVGLRGDVLVVAPVSLTLFGLFQAARRWDARRRLRAEADAWILRVYENRAASRYGWRIDELTSAHERRLLAGTVRAFVAELTERRLSSAVPINRAALRPCRAELVALADRLEALEQPVSPAGILTVQRLITEPGSILYAPLRFDGRPHHTRAVLGAILHHLEVRS
jgi:hypothetical protein